MVDTILLFSCFAGFLLTFILLVFNRGFRPANFMLAGFFLFTNLFVLAQYSGLFGHSRLLAALVGSSVTPFVFLIGPFLYFYHRSILTDRFRFSRLDYIHFIPFLLQLAGMVPYYFSSWEYKLSVADILLSENWQVTHLNLNKFFPSPINSYLRPLHLSFYLILQYGMLREAYKRSRFNVREDGQNRMVEKWSLLLTFFYSIFILCYLVVSVQLFKYPHRGEFQQHSQGWLMLASLGILVVNLVTFLFPRVLYGSPRIKTVNERGVQIGEFSKEMAHDSEIPSPGKQLNQVRTEALELVHQRLNQLLENEQPWTDRHFSLSWLSVKLDIPEHHLRFYFNQYLKISFVAYRNKLRVEHAKRLLDSGLHDQLTMEGIGSTAGFASRSSFFAVFRELTGLTPTEYLNRTHGS